MNPETLLLSLPILMIEAFFSGSEIALLSCDRLKLQQKAKTGHSGAKLAQKLLLHPERIFSTTLLMTSLCVISISALFTLFFLEQNKTHGEWFAVAISSPLIVFLGELIPKSISQRLGDRIAPKVAPVVYMVYWIFYPITVLLSLYSSRITKLTRPLETFFSTKKHTTRDELRTLLSGGKKEADLTTSEQRMIKRIFDFKDTEAKHALIPLIRVDAIDETATFDEALLAFRAHRHSRLPVYRDRVDNIVGVLKISDLLKHRTAKPMIQTLVIPAQYVAETQNLDDLLKNMREDNSEMVIVVDEYGGAVGILTLEDILEEIVGEIQDEYDSEQMPYKELGQDHWLIEARMELTQINESLKLEIPEGDYETLAGFLLQQFGRIPDSGDELYFDTPAGSLRFTVKSATDRRILTIEVEHVDEKE